MNELQQEYFEWMYGLVVQDNGLRNLSFKKLLVHLFETDFICVFNRDENRVSDGVDFRYIFGLEAGYSDDFIKNYIDIKPCSVLELMVSLAYRIEDDIMDDSSQGNRTGKWFWDMIISLGLATMNDYKYDSRYVDDVLYRFMYRKYKRNGEGGLFTVNSKKDLRRVEIWSQAMWYLDEKFAFIV